MYRVSLQNLPSAIHAGIMVTMHIATRSQQINLPGIKCMEKSRHARQWKIIESAACVSLENYLNLKMNNSTETAQNDSTSNMESMVYFLSAIYGLEMATAVGTNLLIIVLVLNTKQLWTQENLFMCHLLCCDLIIGFLGFTALCLWHLYPSMCGVSCALYYASCDLVFFALFFAMAEKYGKICHPFHYATVFTTKRCIVMVLLGDTIAVFMNTVNLFSPVSGPGGENIFDEYCACHKLTLTVYHFPVLSFVVIIFVCIACMVFRILKEAQRHRRQIAAQAAEIQTTSQNISRAKLLSFLSLFTFTCFIPLNVMFLGNIMNESTHVNDDEFVLNLVICFIVGLNTITDPLALLIVHPALRKALTTCCTERRCMPAT